MGFPAWVYFPPNWESVQPFYEAFVEENDPGLIRATLLPNDRETQAASFYSASGSELFQRLLSPDCT